MLRLFLKLSLCIVSLYPCYANAQKTDANANHAETVEPENDPNYNLTGEYVGTLQVESVKSNGKSQKLAIQLRYMGDQYFEGLMFRGGLPGQKGHRGKKTTRLVGRRAGDFVNLSGGSWAIFVAEGKCRIIDRNGELVGELERVHRTSPTMHAPPPKQAQVIFDGMDTAKFMNGRISSDGYLMEGARWKPMFQDFDLHLEFKLPYVPDRRNQNRGNSGIYIQGRYELQVLDSFATPGVFNGCGSLYRQQSPRINMCFPPLTWQTYDVRFTAPRWSADGTKSRNARLTVWHNGVKIHHNYELKNKTGAGQQEGPTLLPTLFQDHGNSVRYRNVWIIDRGLARAKFPVFPSKKQVRKTLSLAKEVAAARKQTAQANPEEAEDSKKVSEGNDAK